VGKYTSLQDSYISVVKSLEHAALACERKLVIEWVEAEQLEKACLLSDPVKYHESWRTLVDAQYFLLI
jgi:CTP synthase